ncbi:MAG: alpha/beta hydrolase [Eubacteriales bacterium]|nr:alpha/beta hydrolase [Eubacteriales bacterium]MDD4475361.1 alpha/beta hydrolase [Eubacteriales bacterium]
MICEKLKIYDKNIYDGCENVVLETYIRATSKELPVPPRPAVLVFGGGGYEYVSDREVEPIVNLYLAAGYNAFALRYSVAKKAAGGKPVLDAAQALYTIRKNAAEWHIDPEKIAVWGASAGGHLAATISTVWHREELYKTLDIPFGSAKVNAAILAYPVISGITSPHQRTFCNIVGKETPSKEELEFYSCELNVTENTPPTFIWHTMPDSCVKVENSLVYANALSNQNIPYELHIFPMGEHGISRATTETSPNPSYDIPYIARWGGWSVKWLEFVFSSKS